MPADAAGRVLARVTASRGEGGQQGVAPLVVFGLLQHECKLSVQVRAGAARPAPAAGSPAREPARHALAACRGSCPADGAAVGPCSGSLGSQLRGFPPLREPLPPPLLRPSTHLFSACAPAPRQHYGVRKAAGYEEPLPSKEPLLLVNGLRSFRARPIYSTDEHGADKHKMERFLHEGR